MVLLLIGLFIPLCARATWTPEGLVDTYYAWDFNEPRDHEREFTTQPGQHDKGDVNLIYAGLSYKSEKLRGRVSLQWGESVIRNTELEPKGPGRNIQESYLGVKVGETWVDAGIYLGHIGMESWISKDNWTYSRSLQLDYVPYYSAGIRVEHGPFQFHLMQGWQNISENNSAKSVGLQYKRKLSDKTQFIYNNFFGDEEVVSSRSRFRGYHNFIVQHLANELWQLQGSADFGHQSMQEESGVVGWGALALTVRRVLTDRRSVALRTEIYQDPHEANVRTNTEHGFRVSGLSVNYDLFFLKNLLWRTEVRGLFSRDEIFPKVETKSREDAFGVTSLTAWF